MRSSRFMRHAAAPMAVVVLVTAHCAFADKKNEADASGGGPASQAAQLVRDALVAEAEGNDERRAGYLQDALAVDADYAPAHWHSGEVRVGDKWLSIDEAAEATTRAGKMAQYRRLRDQVAATADAQLKLAHWCANAGLTEQERVHLIYAMQMKPTTKQQVEIVRKLGLVRRDGTFISPPQEEAIKSRAKKASTDMQEWKSRLVVIRRDIEGPDPVRRAAALKQLTKLRDPTAIEALEVLFKRSSAEASAAIIAALDKMPGQAATDALIRRAVFAKSEANRQAAAQMLSHRPLFDYAPTLMSALQSPVEVQFETYYQNGWFAHRLRLYQEGPLVDEQYDTYGGPREDVTYSRAMHRTVRDRFDPIDRTAEADAVLAAQQLEANEVRNELNSRVMAALQVATNNPLEADPKLWWDWWMQYNEIYQPPYKPVSYTSTSGPVNIRYVSCFVEGTPIWTSTGSMPIEQVHVGECVLAQDPESGELAYKPVMATTVRPPSPLIEIHVAGETIQATRGHPFWVDGIGWQMAKELKAGQYLHTTHGPAAIESAKEEEEAQCYNLIVADFNTYFVSDAQVLVHDNNLRQVTTATVPGLVDP